MVPQIGLEACRLWNGKFLLKEIELEVFLSYIAKRSFDQLSEVSWNWKSFTNKRIQTIQFNDMSDSVMALKKGQELVGVALKYATKTYYDYDPQYAKPAQVVIVLSPQKQLDEAWRSENGLEFRVKHSLDAREAYELAYQFRGDKPEGLPVPLWKGIFTLKGETLRTALLKLAKIEDFRSLPELKWEWEDKSVKVISPLKVKAIFSRLMLRGTLSAIAIKYESKCPSKHIYEKHHKSDLLYTVLHIVLLTKDISPLSFRLENMTSFLVSDHLFGLDACEIENYQQKVHHGAP